LAMLPGSRLVTRMFARLALLLTLHEPEGEDAWIGLQPPAEYDDEELGRYSTMPSWMGERTLSMNEMLELVPPSMWSAHWGRSPAELLQAARDIGDNDLVIRAWTDAAIRVRDGEYAEARLRMPGGKHPGVGETKVAEVIPPERLEPLVLERLSARGLNAATGLLYAVRFPWSPALTRAVLAELPADMPDRVRNPSEFKPELMTASLGAPFMHPTTAVAVLREQGDPHKGEWVELIHLRHTLHQAFS
ncbi:MAG TPA: DUF5691 domain-containing protein, partial [Longimicrobium sp.]|nr:DUF5691 domain-containing protein [Longimicrobium sp.]